MRTRFTDRAFTPTLWARKAMCACNGALVLALALAMQSPLLAWRPIGNIAEGEKTDFAKERIEYKQIRSLGLGELRILRGIVFGRHGRIFKDHDIQHYLEKTRWYKPNPHYGNAALNATERHNLDVIREAEAHAHSRIEPGDWRFYRDRAVTPKQLGQPSLAELRIMQAEIEAMHGKRFPGESWLQNYFNERYWYAPVPQYDPGTLSAVERRNLALLVDMEERQRHIKLSPGDMKAFQNRTIRAGMLHGLSLHELRLLRNEIYALRGRRFQTQWLQEYFDSQTWYKPSSAFREAALSRVEKSNIDTIVHYENGLHEDLSRRLLSRRLLAGLFLEDARKLRNEIYARRGRKFKDPWLQGYFSSFPWYRPNSRFTEASLTAVEKKNVATILKYEWQAESVMRQVEA
jgi:YARHG domain